MASTYTTVLGDCWDLIAYKLFGDEGYMKELVEANRGHIDTLVFPSGVELSVPDIGDGDGEEAFWEYEDDEEEEEEEGEDDGA